ncbi:hypothetical protein CN887_20815 [Bacillus pseudomycoides]|uniref:HGGxSTG domain-containing protein n=1 Tax=Bacillus pseudomycoides TaxID=64104 RepID=UPI00030C43C6|nr:HGGxSTG domain-containing protein [Bacillus pseudomycoides]PDZ72474.1 hypothetical protein CON58_18415 [Bacillus pseudomycoides]PEJ23413.1 hypothetical protein CN887_20815 [Bacillus pseudomycoides]PEM41495.1 hypothetical protein CN634_01530 [Bacillus pseudomycoides]
MAKYKEPHIVELQVRVDMARENDNELALKEAKKELKALEDICGAVKGSGKICVNKPYLKEDGTTNGRCVVHSGKPSGQTTEEGRQRSLANLNKHAAMTHGVYSKNFVENLTEQELALYYSIIAEHSEDEDLQTPANQILLQRFAMDTLKLLRIEQYGKYGMMGETTAQTEISNRLIRLSESLGLNAKFTKQNKKSTNPVVNLNQLFDLGNN